MNKIFHELSNQILISRGQLDIIIKVLNKNNELLDKESILKRIHKCNDALSLSAELIKQGKLKCLNKSANNK